MIANYLKVAARNLMRNKSFSAINILGLAIGMACCMLILLYVQDDLSYDRHHENADRIFRLANELRVSGKTHRVAITSFRMGPALVQDYPVVVDAVRFFRKVFGKTLVGTKEDFFYEQGVFFTDWNVFRVFDFPLSKGDPHTALQDPYSIVLTAEMARKYFGDDNPMGRTLSVDRKLFKVTGILENPIYNSHLRFDFLASPIERHGDDWIAQSYHTYLLLQDNASAALLEMQLPDFVERHIGARIETAGIQLKPFLQPLADIHLHSGLEFEIGQHGDIRYVYLFLVIAAFVLLLACINFANLSTARSAYRSKEVGMRKVAGAYRGQLIFQFFGEAILLALIALVVAVVLVEILLPSFGAFVERDLVVNYLKSRDILLVLIAVLLFAGVLSGSYPALFLSSFQPVGALGGVSDAVPKKTSLQKTLVIVQFAVSTILIVGTGVVNDQAGYIRNKRLGFRPDHVIMVPYGNSDVTERFRNTVSTHSTVLNVSASSTVPGREIASHYFRPLTDATHKEPLVMNVMFVDHEFIETFGFELLDGRVFSEDVDRHGTFILNHAAMRKLGWTSRANQKFAHVFAENGEFKLNVQGDVVGVVKDFHYKSLHHVIEPLVIMLVEGGWTNYISVRIRPDDVAGTLAFLKAQWREVSSGAPFEYSFLDVSFDQLYRSEARLGVLFGSFSLLAILIAGLGLFGLVSLSVQQRTKEIGVRKAVGASVCSIVLLLSREYVLLVGVANLVAWPIAYYAMDRWLENFAYRVDLAISTFVLGGLLALCIALITVSYETLKAARANPVDALRYE